ncbi:MAG TPA: cytotoxic translational repressor of toxin-antitoxin stability system [Allocoleopsis sp.]
MMLKLRYAKSFLRDLEHLELEDRRYIYKFVFEDVPKISKIQELPDLHPIGSGGMFYRFTLSNYLIGLEVIGDIIKFLRVLPKPTV